MRRAMSSLVLCLAVLMPSVGNAQVPADEPILVQGQQFYPTREFRIFDANVMTKVGEVRRVPVYVDATLEANTVVYVPVGGKTMKAYRRGEPQTPTTTTIEPALERPVGTTGTLPAPAASVVTPPRRRLPPVQTTLQPQGRNGIWIEYGGSRWYAAGKASVYYEDQFEQIGEHSGFPVYRAVGDKTDGRIWVAAAIDGPLTPFVRK